MTYTYQHKKDASNISGATSAAYSLSGGALEGDSGEYTVTVTNSNSGLSRTFGPVDLVVTGDSALTATVSNATPVAGVSVDFRSDALQHGTGTVSSYSWDFGDGTVPATTASPSHFFVGTSTYTVTLTVTYDDDSTDTDTIAITPTTPAATSGQTIDKRVNLTATLNNSTYNSAPYDFTYWNGATGEGKSLPVGAKLASVTNAGYHVYSTGNNWMAGWTIGTPNSSGVIRQMGAWFYIESAPATYMVLFPFRASGGQIEGVGIDSNRKLAWWNYTLSKTVIDADLVLPLNEWFWIGSAHSGTSHKINYRSIDGVTEEWDASFGTYFGSVNDWCCGPWNVNGNVSHGLRIANITRHTLTALTDAGYPGEVVPPQSANHIYLVDPNAGDDTNDGITGAWQTITKVNSMFATAGVISEHTSGTEGSGAELSIDTSTTALDVGEVGLQIYRPGVWLHPPKPYTLQTDYIDFQAAVDIGSGDWTPHATYTGIWQISCDHLFARVFEGDTFYAKVASEAALDAAATKASYASGTTLFVKPDTDPTTDGKSYRYTRVRPLGGESKGSGNPIGFPVVAVAGADQLLDGVRTRYTAVNNNGSYAIGDITGFSSKLKVRGADCRYGDKHLICFTANATNSTITVEDSYVEQGLGQILTSFMDTGSGNAHLYRRVETGAALLLERSSTGETPKHGSGTGVFYCHGNYGVFSSITFENCTFLGSVDFEAIVLAVAINGGTYEHINTVNIPTTISSGTVLNSIPLCGNLTASGLTINFTSGNYGLSKALGGSLTNSTIDCRGHTAVAAGLWTIGSTALTFTGNTVQFAVGTSSPVFGDCEDGDFVASDNNTYYLPSGSTLWDDYNPGAGAADYTFAGVQGLGYEANSTRLDPV